MSYEKRISDLIEGKLSEKIVDIKKAQTGMDNVVYFIKTDKNDYVIRFATEDLHALKSHKYAYGLWRGLGVPVPDVFLTGDDFVLEQRLKGEPLQNVALESINLESFVKELGKILTKIHSVKLSGYGYLDENQKGEYDSWEEAMHKYIGKRLIEFKKNVFLGGYLIKKVEGYLVDNFKVIKIDKACMIHKDFNDGNILVYRGVLSGIIDASDVMSGDSMFDVGSVYESFEEKYFSFFIESYNCKIDMEKVFYYGVINAIRGINTFALKKDNKKLKFHLKRLNDIFGKSNF